jgi:hypothetical protein
MAHLPFGNNLSQQMFLRLTFHIYIFAGCLSSIYFNKLFTSSSNLFEITI